MFDLLSIECFHLLFSNRFYFILFFFFKFATSGGGNIPRAITGGRSKFLVQMWSMMVLDEKKPWCLIFTKLGVALAWPTNFQSTKKKFSNFWIFLLSVDRLLKKKKKIIKLQGLKTTCSRDKGVWNFTNPGGKKFNDY